MMEYITLMNLSRLPTLDLNLFLLLHTVLEENSTTRAAKRLSVTQSAVSNGLARLRVSLGDPLFVRSGRGLVPTPRATALRPLLAQAIGQLATAAEGGDVFAPEASTRRFTLAAGDNHQAREVPLIAAAFARELPRADLRVVSTDFL